MPIIIAFFCGLCFYMLSESVADCISAKAQKIEAQAGALKVQGKLKELRAEKGESTDE